MRQLPIGSWPVWRQLTGPDRTGRAASVKSRQSDSLRARTASADRVVKSVCPYCAVGCAQNVYVHDERVVQIEGDPDSPISRGRLCPKGAASLQLTTDSGRLAKVRYRPPYATDWQDLDLDTAMEMIADRVIRTRRETWQWADADGRRLARTMGIASLGGATLDNEENYLIKKLFTALGVIQVENQARVCHSSTVIGLGTSFGRGGATTFMQDLQHADCIVIEGSNFAEAHPVGFQWVMAAKARGATVIHVDPRFTRTSALADLFVPIRAGTDVAFLGGIINHVLTEEKDFREYVLAYTNASTIVDERFQDTEDLDGLFSGFNPETHRYGEESWQYEGVQLVSATGERDTQFEARQAARQDIPAGDPLTTQRDGHEAGRGEKYGSGGAALDGQPRRDPTLQNPRCVYQILKRHFARYTPEMVQRICGIPPEVFAQVCRHLVDNSGPERTSEFVYAVGWTQHTDGSQFIRSASILQLLLGNIGRPGGGIQALRGHASIQGSTDIPTLFNLLPGYIPMPHAHKTQTLNDFIVADAARKGFWADMRAYAVSLLKAWWGPVARPDNDFCFDYLPRISGSHSHYDTVLEQLAGNCKGYFLLGENPAVGSANTRMQRFGMANLDWLVVRDLCMIESATWWKDGPEIASGELSTDRIGTEVFVLPAAAHTEKAGSFTNTNRLLQWHHQAVEPADDRRSELWFMYHLGRIIRQKLTGSTDPMDRPILDLTWDYPTTGRTAEPDPEAVLAEINGWDGDGRPLSTYTELADDGSTVCGCWIYCGVYSDGVNQAARRKPAEEQHWVSPEWAWAWPANRRLLYNRASARPDGTPWSERKRYVWWDADAGKWTGYDVPDFEPTKPPDYQPPEGAHGVAALRGTDAFIMQADGLGWLYAPTGVADGPLPAHYEPQDSPVDNPLYGQQRNPARLLRPHELNRLHPNGSQRGAQIFPYVVTTYRLTEHFTAGGMSRFTPYLAELQPEFFCEVSPELAAERGLVHAGWATIVTARNAIEARVLVTERIAPLHVDGRVVHQIGLPFHWGPNGYSRGDAANEITSISLDPNSHIQESKALSADIRPGRRPRGPDRVPWSGTTNAGPESPPAPERRCEEMALDLREATGGESDPATAGGYSEPPERVGFFTDTSVCIGCKACEVACKEWNAIPEDGLLFTGMSYDNTGGLGADSWRHVAFVEQPRRLGWQESQLAPTELPADLLRAAGGRTPVSLGMPASAPPDGHVESVPGMDFRWLMSSDVCKHCTHAACLDVCPTGSLFRTEFGTVVVQEDICNGCGYCVPACPYGVIDQRGDDGRVWKCTLCYDRLSVGQEPACAKSCPTDSIQFGELTELRARAAARVRDLHDAGVTDARLYGADPHDGVGGTGAFFLLLDEPEVYGLPPDPVVTTRDLPRMWRRAGLAAVGLLAALVAVTIPGTRR